MARATRLAPQIHYQTLYRSNNHATGSPGGVSCRNGSSACSCPWWRCKPFPTSSTPAPSGGGLGGSSQSGSSAPATSPGCRRPLASRQVHHACLHTDVQAVKLRFTLGAPPWATQAQEHDRTAPSECLQPTGSSAVHGRYSIGWLSADWPADGALGVSAAAVSCLQPTKTHVLPPTLDT